ncbi:MAG: ATP-binding protein [Planctomycetota bacterium]
MHEKKLSVLAVDDDPGDLELLRRYVEEIPEWDVEFHSLTDPGAVGESLSLLEPALLFIDHRLGTMTGLELCELVRRAGFERPVIMLTGYGDERLVVEALHAGVADYLPKNGLSVPRLRRAIDGALERDRLRKELEENRRNLEQTNEELTRRNEEIQNFYHVLSHELKSPLTVAREFLKIVIDKLPGPINAEQEEFLHIARESCDRMVRTINDLLDSARLDTGKMSVSLMPGSISDLVERVVKALRPGVAAGQLTLLVEEPEWLPEVLMDEDRIVQVLTNIINNAVKFTPAGGQIVIGLESDKRCDDLVRVWVRDTGPGIAPEKLPHLFERHFQASEESVRTHGGLGLGLSICRELVKLHGGEIGVESRVGQGSTFHFTLQKHQP